MIRACRALFVLLALASTPDGARAAQAATDTLAIVPPLGVARDTLAGAPEPAPAPAGATAASTSLPPRGGWRGALFRPDRLQHASLSFALGVGVGVLAREPLAGSGVAIGLGLAKELGDERFDRGDFAADLIGAGLAALVVVALTR